MTRDMELVRKILLMMEADPHGFAPDPFVVEGYDEETTLHHAYLMAQGELIAADDLGGFGDSSPMAHPITITWKGHEFIGAAKDDDVWHRASSLARKAGSASFVVLTKALTEVAMDRMLKP